jgi:hypothetical protein
MSHNTKEFNEKADRFTQEYKDQRIALEKCLQSKVNDDINFVCQKPKSAYLEGVAQIFCKQQYDTAVKCQKGAGDRWASDCFDQNVAFGQCTDQVLRKLYIYNIETSRKNPNNV